MIGVDTNILVYAHRRDVEWHDVASRCLTEVAEGASSWCIPWPCVHEFLAKVTHPRIFKAPSSAVEAQEFLRGLALSPAFHFVGEGAGHLEILFELMLKARISGAAVHDARIAAICISNGVRELWTADRDFQRFPQLKTVNPLVN